MTELSSFIKNLDIKSDFTALSYKEWQHEQAKVKCAHMVNRLRIYGFHLQELNAAYSHN